MSESCEFIRDLIPVVASGGASEETKAMVEAHIAACPACKAEYERCLGPAKKKDKKKKPLPIRLLLFFLKLLGAAALVLWGCYLPLKSNISNVIYFYRCFLLFGAGVYTAFVFRRGRYAVVLGTPVAVVLNFYILNGQISVRYNFTDLLRIFYNMGALPTAATAMGLVSGLLLCYGLGRKTAGSPGKSWFQWLRSFVGSKPLSLRIPAGAMGAGVFIALCVYIFGTVGDPVSYLVADGKMREYFSKNYASYGFRYGTTSYMGPDLYTSWSQLVDDPTVIFSIRCYRLGNVTDDFQSTLALTGGPNFDLLCAHLTQKVNGILANRTAYLYASLDSSRVPYSALAAFSGKQEIDSKTSADYLSAALYSYGEFSPEGTALLLTQYYNDLKSKGIVFSSYSVYIVRGAQQVVGRVTGVTPNQIEGDTLTQLLRAAKSSPQQNASGILYLEGDE